jgi:hypothetical protein
MAKRKTLTIEGSRFEGMAFLFFHTVAPNYSFVDDLNHLYSLELARMEDMLLDDGQWPVYYYRDTMRRMTYYLIERPAIALGNATYWGGGQKMLLIQGDGATIEAERIGNDFGTESHKAEEDDIAAQEHNAMIEAMLRDFVMVTLFDPEKAPEGLARKALKERNELQALLERIIDYLDLQREYD